MNDTGVPDSPEQGDPGFFGRIVCRFGLYFSLIYVFSAAALIYEVVMRYVFKMPTIWVHETVTFVSAIGFLYGGLYCVSTEKHIRIVVLYDLLPAPLRRYVDVGIYAVCAIASALFSYAAWLSAKKAIFAPSGALRFETSGTAFNPPYPSLVKVALCIVLGLMAVQFLLFAVRKARGR